ncbi:MAG TPA: right-handed parallel beta-helix repeat-containing protein [Kofleriaceae bacterium]|nr:right-handed parallel beta-helix repeat-containing protein [Kofleriaceae bacterium]
MRARPRSLALRCAALAALIACSAGRPSILVTDARDGCIDPTSYGAVVDDGKDDRVAVQAAIDAARRTARPVCLPVGDLHIARKPGRGRAVTASLIVEGDGVEIRGKGPRSRLVMLAGPETEHPNAWWLLQVTGTRHTLSGFALDGSARGRTHEQTHLVQVTGLASGITLERLSLSIPKQPDNRGGDCIRLLGEMNAPVDGVTIVGVRGETCARSFVAFQRAVSNVQIYDTTSVEVSDQVIDMEPSGRGAIHDVRIRDCNFQRGPGAEGNWALSLAGGDDAAQDLLVQSTTLDGGIFAYHVSHTTIRDCTITGGVTKEALIHVVRGGEGVRILDNRLDRTGLPGDGIYLGHHGTSWPTDVILRGNHIRLRGDGIPIHGEPVVGIDIDGNTIDCAGPGPNRNAAVTLRGNTAPISRVRVRGNSIRGTCAGAVRIASYRENVTGSAIVKDNVVEGASYGVQFDGAEPTTPPVVDDNVFDGVATERQVTGLRAGGFTGQNSGGARSATRAP